MDLRRAASASTGLIEFGVGLAEGEIGIRNVRVEFGGAFEFDDGFVELVLAEVDVAELRVAEIIVGIISSSLRNSATASGEINFAEAEDVGGAEGIVRAGSFRIFGDGFFEFDDGLLGKTVLGVGPAEVHADGGGVSEGGEHFGENFRGVFGVFGGEVGGSEGVTVVEVGLERDGVFELDACGGSSWSSMRVRPRTRWARAFFGSASTTACERDFAFSRSCAARAASAYSS